MSAASLRVLKGQIQRGVANLDTIDVWEAKKTVTAAEANEARAYWHELNPPAPEPEPTPEPATGSSETPATGETTEQPAS